MEAKGQIINSIVRLVMNPLIRHAGGLFCRAMATTSTRKQHLPLNKNRISHTS